LSEGEQETKIIRCNECKNDTHHYLRATYSRQINRGPAEIRSSIWSCAGCDDETFEWRIIPLDDPEEGLLQYFPQREEDSMWPKHFTKLNPRLSGLYKEVIACFNNGSLLLCTIGLRALLEGICGDKGLTDGNLEHKIDGLINFINSPNLIEALHAFRFAGNAAAHELEAIESGDARQAIDVMEDLLKFLYELDYKASRMKYASGRDASMRTALKSVEPGSVQ
jgi:hypothetical protein